ncbi:uncharacterized protein BP5553_03075 [Venustampulla echinocandica]|uniref:Spherulin 4-like cell surface protein n=1 Tax=Venustampulla echinocandica TaxID=2656787 RepID=A0A370TT82_9HELO|nr:uncharacterized protein BP5553_03075 [Venustampulla echinocandica]RDL38735.1 hypothetical protein BP5553_03075 [Venustampulla echinocandica]
MPSRKVQSYCGSKIFGVPKYVFWVLLGVAIIVIVVPVAVMFGRKKHIQKSSVLVPLYVYPDPGAWDPLYDAIEKNPTLDFTVVMNPESGPGNDSLPDSNYTSQIPRLTTYPNVVTVGYVSTNYSNRDISAVLQDIRTYAGWSGGNVTIKSLGMRGIFFDETPADYTAASGRFYGTVAAMVRSQPGFGDDPLIIHNPGVIPDPRYLSSCNQTVVFEGAYDTYQKYKMQKNITTFLSQNSKICTRDNLATIVHSMPSSVSAKGQMSLVKDLRGISRNVFVTGLSVDYYSSFWNGWEGFVQDVAAQK